VGNNRKLLADSVKPGCKLSFESNASPLEHLAREAFGLSPWHRQNFGAGSGFRVGLF